MRSQRIKLQFWIDYCKRIFGNIPEPDTEWTNWNYGGLDIESNYVYFVNAVEDPWKYAGMRQLS